MEKKKQKEIALARKRADEAAAGRGAEMLIREEAREQYRKVLESHAVMAELKVAKAVGRRVRCCCDYLCNLNAATYSVAVVYSMMVTPCAHLILHADTPFDTPNLILHLILQI